MFEDLIASASQKWGVPESWIGAVIQTESSGNPNAVNSTDPGGSRGLMQISGPTAKAYGITDLSTLFNPAINIDTGAHILHDLRQKYGEDLRRVYSAYNSGNPDLWMTSAQVSNNVGRVMSALGDWTAAHPIGDATIGVLALLVLWWMRKK